MLFRSTEQAKREAQAKIVSQARANAVSVKTQTPASTQTTAGKKGLRAQLEEATDQVMGARV